MRLSNARFLDYTNYNQNQYANASNHYEDNFIISGFTINEKQNLLPGELFLNGWHLTFSDQLSLITPAALPYICVSYKSTLGNATESLYESNYTKGKLTASVSQLASPIGYVLYRYINGSWVLQSNGRIDSINGKKANLANNLNLGGSDIKVQNPIYGTDAMLNVTLSDINTRIDELTGGGLSISVGNNIFYNMFNVDAHFTPEQLANKTMAAVVKLIGEAIPQNQPTMAYGNTFGERAYAKPLKNLFSLYYGYELASDYISYTIQYNTNPKDFNNGGTVLTIMPNNSTKCVQFLIDNFGNNVGVWDSDTFRPVHLFSTYMEISGSAVIRDQLTAGSGNFVVNNAGTSLSVPSDFTFFIPGVAGSQTIKFNERVRVGDYLNVGDKFFAYSDGSMTSWKMGSRQIEFENSTGTGGTKNIVLNHDNGALAGLLEWSRRTNGANSIDLTLVSRTEGLTYVGLHAKENQRFYNFATNKFVMESSTYLAREELLITELIDSQTQLDGLMEKQALQEAQINALVNGETVPKALPKKLRSNGKLAALKQLLADNQTEQYEEEYKCKVEMLDTQIANLRSSLKAVNVKSTVEPSLVGMSDVLDNALQQRALLEEAYNKGEQL